MPGPPRRLAERGRGQVVHPSGHSPARPRTLRFVHSLKGLRRLNEPRQLRQHPTESAMLVVIPRRLHMRSRCSSIHELWTTALEQSAGKSMRCHQRVAHRGHVILAALVLDQHRLAQKITHRHSEGLGDLCEHVQPPHWPLTPLDLAQPVLGAAHKARHDGLGKTAPSTVEGDPLAHAEVVPCSPHDLSLRLDPRP